MSFIICLLSFVIGASQMHCAYASVNPSKGNLTEEWLADLAEYRSILNDWRKLVEEECDLSDSEDVWQSLFKYHNSNETSSMNDQYDIRQRYRQEREIYKKIMEFYKNIFKYCKPRSCSQSTTSSEDIASTEAVTTQPFVYTSEGSDTKGDSSTHHSVAMTTNSITTVKQQEVTTPSTTVTPCHSDDDGGNWTVLQRRLDGSVDFNRNWTEYENGFGDLEGEFWLGLSAIHELTKSGDHELLIDMIDTDGACMYAAYSNFSVGSSLTNYLLTVGGYSGNATDAMANPPSDATQSANQQQFSTFDLDNDNSFFNCALFDEAGWWFNNCGYANLNVFYPFWTNQSDGRNMLMRFAEMKTRKSMS